MASLGLTDKPISKLNEESLGVQGYMESLSKFIKVCETPMTISIQADWGAGKTSMMYLVKEELEKEEIETIWFNTWQFSQFDMGNDLPFSLLSHFFVQLGETDTGIEKLFDGIKMFAKFGTKVLAKQAGLGDEYDDLIKTNKDVSSMIAALKNKLADAVKIKIKNKTNKRVVIFIDDLDRLAPEKAVELLEIMKLFLDIEGCVFVLAIDYNVVVKGLEKKFGTSVDDIKGRSFFDKIIQLPFNLPVGHYDTGNYFKSLLDQGNFEYNSDDIPIFENLAKTSVGFNPRSMKRLINSLLLLKMVADQKDMLYTNDIANSKEKTRILFAVLCLQTAYSPMYSYILNNQSVSKNKTESSSKTAIFSGISLHINGVFIVATSSNIIDMAS